MIVMNLFIVMNLNTQHIIKNNMDGSRKTPTSCTLNQAIVFFNSFWVWLSELNIHRIMGITTTFDSKLFIEFIEKWWSLFSKNPFL